MVKDNPSSAHSLMIMISQVLAQSNYSSQLIIAFKYRLQILEKQTEIITF